MNLADENRCGAIGQRISRSFLKCHSQRLQKCHFITGFAGSKQVSVESRRLPRYFRSAEPQHTPRCMLAMPAKWNCEIVTWLHIPRLFSVLWVGGEDASVMPLLDDDEGQLWHGADAELQTGQCFSVQVSAQKSSMASGPHVSVFASGRC